MTSKVTITASEYKKMQREIAKLHALESGGVDNWEWYSESLSDWNKENELDEFLDQANTELHERLVEADVDFPAGREAGASVTLSDDHCRAFFDWFIKEYEAIKAGDE